MIHSSPLALTGSLVLLIMGFPIYFWPCETICVGLGRDEWSGKREHMELAGSCPLCSGTPPQILPRTFPSSSCSTGGSSTSKIMSTVYKYKNNSRSWYLWCWFFHPLYSHVLVLIISRVLHLGLHLFLHSSTSLCLCVFLKFKDVYI